MDPEVAEQLLGSFRELFDDLKEISGTDEGAAEIWKDAFWFAFDGNTLPVIPEESMPQLLGWVNGAKKIVTTLKDGGFLMR